MHLSLLLHDYATQRWLEFTYPVRILEVHTLADILPALEKIDRAVKEQSLWAAGFLAYEAASAFDRAMVTHPSVEGLPLLWFGLFPEPNDQLSIDHSPLTIDNSSFSPSPYPLFSLSLPEPAYHAAIAQIKAHIAAGNTYQVNYTMRMHTRFDADPFSFFLQLVQSQQTHYAAYIHTGRHAICSTSPELFFELDGDLLRSKPMKGTAPRGRTLAEDQVNADWLYHSEKNRAENVMIVDMVRNDMGRIAEIGSVHVPRLYEIEHYPTVLQMTSTVECRTRASLPEIFTALFPCASITGAPKIRTMKIIRELEPEPRGVYTGAIGFIAPGRRGRPMRAQFNVAIRTVVVDTQTGQAEYGTGSGIVWDSDPADEYGECLLKTRVLVVRRPTFDLLESLLWTPEQGFFLLKRHLARLQDSAEFFDFPFHEDNIRTKLVEITAFLTTPHKIRLLLDSTGKISLETHPISSSPFPLFPFSTHPPCLSAALAPSPISSTDIFLFHKTTHRQIYDQAHAACSGFDEVLLWNERGEVTEFTASNVVIQLGEQCYTPPVTCGLLPGTFRAELLEKGIVTEQVIRVEELTGAEAIWAVNSVRGWRKVNLRSGLF
ncbi:MAG TPA: aminodeoxychorismate synthase component I [Anaerolineales bacterium]|nr:aminodeoxychorismate synthase component I [Anaerolineales bacterium]